MIASRLPSWLVWALRGLEIVLLAGLVAVLTSAWRDVRRRRRTGS